MKVEVFCTLKVEGTHSWPWCPFDEVAYLRDPHRHLFGIKAYKAVKHTDRDVEFIVLTHRIREYLKKKYTINSTVDDFHEFGAMSCEMLAKELIGEFDLTRCEVDEDGENGSVVTA